MGGGRGAHKIDIMIYGQTEAESNSMTIVCVKSSCHCGNTNCIMMIKITIADVLLIAGGRCTNGRIGPA